ncbi:REP-associated tyrosine transposase [Pseudorhodobacter antarcticus]|nr:transposase [Pseudorhodobacter antarcticus]
MSRYLRPHIPGATMFFTAALACRGADILTRHVADLRAAVRATKAERPFAIDAWVVLPDHMHCVWTLPEGDCDYATRMGAIKARFTRSMRRVGFHPTDAEIVDGAAAGWTPTPRSPSKVRKGDGGIWQRRFYEHHIRGEADFAACVRYCWINPVKHGFVERPEDWPFSSYRRDMGGDLNL